MVAEWSVNSNDSSTDLFPEIKWMDDEETNASEDLELLLLTKPQPMAHRGLVRSWAFESGLESLDTLPLCNSSIYPGEGKGTSSLFAEAKETL